MKKKKDELNNDSILQGLYLQSMLLYYSMYLKIYRDISDVREELAINTFRQ